MFNKFIINIFSNCVSNEAIFCDKKDCPKLNKKIKNTFFVCFHLYCFLSRWLLWFYKDIAALTKKNAKISWADLHQFNTQQMSVYLWWIIREPDTINIYFTLIYTFLKLSAEENLECMIYFVKIMTYTVLRILENLHTLICH